jgi:putative transposase
MENIVFSEQISGQDVFCLPDDRYQTDPRQIVLDASDPSKLRFRLVQWLAAAPDRETSRQRKQEVASTLKISTRQVERLLRRFHAGELDEENSEVRADKGSHRVDPYWVEYIQKAYEQGNKSGRMSPSDVAREVKRHAIVDRHLEDGQFPHPATVFRVLKPLVERSRIRKKTRNPGSGSWMVLETRNGKSLKIEFSNQILQSDHTKLDVLVVDRDGEVVGRPWLTTVVDSYSSCILGYFLGMKQPGSHEVTLALRHAALPKHYPDSYELVRSWDVGDLPIQYFFTDGGKDLARSKHIQKVGQQFGFACELRARPCQGGIVERLFGTINTRVLKGLPGYTGSNVQERPEDAEKTACLTIKDVEKILVGFFCDAYNQEAYPKDVSMSRFERWLKGMGGHLPESIDERALDICLMKEMRRVVQAHGSVQFENLIYRSEVLRSHIGQQVILLVDPDNICCLQAYGYDSNEFIATLDAINLEYQDLTLDELKRMNKKRSKAGQKIDNYSTLVDLGRRDRLVEERKKSKKERQRESHLERRKVAKSELPENSKVIEMKAHRPSPEKKVSQAKVPIKATPIVQPALVETPLIEAAPVAPPLPTPEPQPRIRFGAAPKKQTYGDW